MISKSMKLKKVIPYHQAHGWNKGGYIDTEIMPCIDSGIAKWHTLLWEEYEDQDEYEEGI